MENSIGKIEYKQAEKLQKNNTSNPFTQGKTDSASIFLNQQTASKAQAYSSDTISSAEAKYIAEQMKNEKSWFSTLADKFTKTMKKEKTSSENIKSEDKQEKLTVETNANSDTSGQAFDAE